MKDLIVVTGCDSGVGLSLASNFAARGTDVTLSYLAEHPLEGRPCVTAGKMDLRDEEEIDAFAAFVRRQLLRIPSRLLDRALLAMFAMRYGGTKGGA